MGIVGDEVSVVIQEMGKKSVELARCGMASNADVSAIAQDEEGADNMGLYAGTRSSNARPGKDRGHGRYRTSLIPGEE